MNDKPTVPEPEQIKAMEPEKLIKQYDNLIHKVVKRYSQTVKLYAWIDEDDLLQIAMIAIVDAQKTYNPEGGSSFVSYAYQLIRWRILQELKIRRTQEGYQLEQPTISLDEPIEEDGETTRGELIESMDLSVEECAELADKVTCVRNAVRNLPNVQEEIITRLYLNEPTETPLALAKEKGISSQAIGSKERSALKKLRSILWDLQPYHQKHIGLKKFNSIWMSEPEQYAITQEERIERLKKWYEKYTRAKERMDKL